MRLTTKRIDSDMEKLEVEYAIKKKAYEFVKAKALEIAAVIEPILAHHKIKLMEDFTGGQVYFSAPYNSKDKSYDFNVAVISYNFSDSLIAYQTINAINKKIQVLGGHCLNYGLTVTIRKEKEVK